MADWKAIQKALDDRNERERVARVARADAAVDRAMADLGRVPEHVLEKNRGEEPVCPNCFRRNALIGRHWTDGGRWLLVCRDCNYACFERDPKGVHRYGG